MMIRMCNRLIKISGCKLRINTKDIMKMKFCTKSSELSIADSRMQKYLENISSEYHDLKSNQGLDRTKDLRMLKLSNAVSIFGKRNFLVEDLNILQAEIKLEQDIHMIKMMEEEKLHHEVTLRTLDEDLMKAIFNIIDDNSYPSMILEVNAGVGGQEAMLFAMELFDMYCGYSAYKRWKSDIIHIDHTDLGGIRHATSLITSYEAFNLLKYEAGVHRVQRIPTTEKSGRIHTSTVTIAVIPTPDDLDLNIKDKDLKIETKRASGAGGQHVNTTESAVRIVHLPTGISVECQTDRSQIKNKETALKKLRAKLCQDRIESNLATKTATKKSQVGLSLRNEKIRTYNFNQDRITDHRIEGGTLHNLADFLEGGNTLDELIHKIKSSIKKQEIFEMITNSKF